MQKIDIENIVSNCREFDVNETLQFLRMHQAQFWSWGANGFTSFKSKALIFRVNGNHHKGRVYIVLNGADLFDVYLTSSQGNIKQTFTDIYIDELFDLLDQKIEFIPQYTH
ncbi:MAG: hypothetical protein WCJ62_07440 [Flavobacterium sp.]